MPTTELDRPYSQPDASPVPWSAALAVLRDAGISWISTVRADGRPHVTPLVTAWQHDALWFTTGAHEQKARNLVRNPACVVTTGTNDHDAGLDVVVEGQADPIDDDDVLGAVAGAFAAKYGDRWRFAVADGRFAHHGRTSLVFRVAPVKVLGFHRGENAGATRWRF